MKGAKGKYTIITSKKAKKVDIAKIDISKENKIYFSYRHFSLFEYLTSQEFRKMFNESKTNYQKTLSLFIQNKLTDNDRNKTLLPAMRNSKISPQQKNFQKITNQSENKQKKFICVGGYSDIIKYLQKRGWVLNKDAKSTDFDFIWTLKTVDINYSLLRKEQIAAHFCRNGAITRKSGLCRNIKNLYYKGIDPNNFFPRCYDLSDKNDMGDFIEDFKTNKAISILKRTLTQLNEGNDNVSLYSENVIKAAIDIVQRNSAIIIGDYSEINVNNAKTFVKFVTEKEWSLIGEEEPSVKGDISSYIATIAQASRIGLHSNEIKYPHLNLRSQSELPKKLKSLHITVKKRPSNKIDNIIGNKKQTTKLSAIQKYKAPIQSLLSLLSSHQSQYIMNGVHNIWIIKPGSLSRGRGISVSNKLSTILESHDDSNQVIVQKYIENPLIILGRKFDIRQWVLVTNLNPLTIWIWEEPYLRFGAEDYNINDMSNLYSHLTNNSIAKHSEHFRETKIEGNMWERHQFAEFLQNRYGKDCWKEIQQKIKNIIICSFEAARHEMKQRQNSFELFGYDVMIDENLNVYLIEVNSSPALDYSTKITEKLVKLMLEDLIQVVIDNKDVNEKLNSIGKFSKIYQGQEVDSSYLPNKF